MKKVLYIKANPKADEFSNTFALSSAFVEEYKKNNPEDEVEVLDLYEANLHNLTGQDLDDMFSGKDTEMKKVAEHFATFDKYIIAAPMWNLSIPAILKTYIDYVSYVGVTFKYTAEGPIGLLAGQNKKFIHITSTGGEYLEGIGKDFEMGDRYLRIIMGFMGVEDAQTLALENTGVLQGEDLEKARNTKIAEAKEVAKKF